MKKITPLYAYVWTWIKKGNLEIVPCSSDITAMGTAARVMCDLIPKGAKMTLWRLPLRPGESVRRMKFIRGQECKGNWT